MDALARARQLALAGIEVRATQADAGGGGGKTAHEPAGSPKGGQFTARPGSGGSKATGGHQRPKGKKTAVPQSVPQAPAKPRLVREGDSGEDVRYAQYAMGLLGFNVAQDGRFGPETAAAVKQMQQRLGMKHPNGHITPALLRKMQDAVRLSPCVGQGQRDLSFEALWEQRDDGLEDGDLDFDETTEAVLDAIDEFERSAGAEWDERAAHDVSKELRIPGGKGGGRWTKNPVTSAIAHALEEWSKGNGPDDPFVFDGKPIEREPLRKAAVARGISLKRGASREDIVAALKDDLKVKVADAKAAKPADAGKPVRFTLKGGVDPKLAREIEVEKRRRAQPASRS
jgi:peptidoglycan hydrolase-like protein with peptidoglycan-binding domain